MTRIDETFNHSDPANEYSLSHNLYNVTLISFPVKTLGTAIVAARKMANAGEIPRGMPVIIYGDWSYWHGAVATVSYNGRVRYK